MIELNATRAYKAAYSNCKMDEAAAAAGARLLRNVKVANYIQDVELGRDYNNYLATSPTGTATGFGASLLIIDDLIKNAEEANNELTKDELIHREEPKKGIGRKETAKPEGR